MQYKDPNLAKYVRKICDTFNLDYEYVKATLIATYPELKDRSVCANCSASMVVNEYKADILNAVLLLKCAEQVYKNMEAGKPFTEANLVHVPSLPTTDAVRRRSSQLAALNYLHQPKGKKRTGYYLITTWGWAALRGDAVPKSVHVFRGEIVKRSEETTTLAEMFRTHKDKVENAIKARKTVENDYRADVGGFNVNTWQTIAGYAQDTLL